MEPPDFLKAANKKAGKRAVFLFLTEMREPDLRVRALALSLFPGPQEEPAWVFRQAPLHRGAGLLKRAEYS